MFLRHIDEGLRDLEHQDWGADEVTNFQAVMEAEVKKLQAAGYGNEPKGFLNTKADTCEKKVEGAMASPFSKCILKTKEGLLQGKVFRPDHYQPSRTLEFMLKQEQIDEDQKWISESMKKFKKILAARVNKTLADGDKPSEEEQGGVVKQKSSSSDGKESNVPYTFAKPQPKKQTPGAKKKEEKAVESKQCLLKFLAMVG